MYDIYGEILTYFRLGLSNIVRIIVYRLLCRIGFYKHIQPIGFSYSGPFWRWPSEYKGMSIPNGHNWHLLANRILLGEIPFFSSDWREVGFPPAWAKTDSLIHWTEINEFFLPDGDVKNLWETSRFDGLLILALAWINSADSRLPMAMERWMESWVGANPANAGVQWKCGQETGIRLMHVLLVSELLREHTGVVNANDLERFVVEHCRRITPTMLYAIAQDNNHGTSEAAALYMAGTWLIRQQVKEMTDAEKWRRIGRKCLENRIKRLVMKDGSFSQHSVNYHRLMLDTIAMVEWWRRRFTDAEFTSVFYERCRLAADWLGEMVDPISGDAPNLGANDGARIAVMHGLSYRDFRPSVQLSSVIFEGQRRYPSGKWDEPLFWLGQKVSDIVAQPARLTKVFPDGGYVRLVKDERLWGVLRLPIFRFRPSHADALHFDLWRNGINWLRDGGSYSYNAEGKWMNYFPGTASHSTIQFDERDQMPRLSRFLFGDWLHCEEFVFDPSRPYFVKSSYVDSFGAVHSRSVTIGAETCVVVDDVSGFEKKAVLRWRLPQMKWLCHGKRISSEGCVVKVEVEVPVIRAELVCGVESRHYGEIIDLPVFEVEVADSPARFVTTVHFLS